MKVERAGAVAGGEGPTVKGQQKRGRSPGGGGSFSCRAGDASARRRQRLQLQSARARDSSSFTTIACASPSSQRPPSQRLAGWCCRENAGSPLPSPLGGVARSSPVRARGGGDLAGAGSGAELCWEEAGRGGEPGRVGWGANSGTDWPSGFRGDLFCVGSMEVERDKMAVSVSYRGKTYTAEVPVDATVGELGKQLSQLTGVALHTMRLLVPQGQRVAASSLLPASEEHSSTILRNSGIFMGVTLRMMGATAEELKEVSQPVNKRMESRVLGFEEEERRQKLRSMFGTRSQLPKGPYTFSDFQTLQLPGIELNPPSARALVIMHKLASDPGIVAIMNKHKWQVGIMTELAPVGYVGISPKCLLGFNKNRGQEISLRLRTDDLRGFRKYESIKKTLLHELAHMVHDEHDENFHALDKQLNQEAVALDWTKAAGHTLSGARLVEDDDVPMDVGGVTSGHKLGGSLPPANIRSAAALAAIMRLERNKAGNVETMGRVGTFEPDPDDPLDHESIWLPSRSPIEKLDEPDPDEIGTEIVVIAEGQEPDPDESTSSALVHTSLTAPVTREREPDPDDSRAEPDPDDALSKDQDKTISRGYQEPDPDDMLSKEKANQEPDPDECMLVIDEPDPDESRCERKEPNLDSSVKAYEPDPDENGHDLDLGSVNDEIARIQDTTSAAMTRLQNALNTLKQQASPAETTAAIRTLFTILRNVIDHPSEDKYRRLRKGNPNIHNKVAKYEGAVEVLQAVGFADGECAPGAGGGDCFVLKRSDPGLLWLACSVLQDSLA